MREDGRPFAETGSRVAPMLRLPDVGHRESASRTGFAEGTASRWLRGRARLNASAALRIREGTAALDRLRFGDASNLPPRLAEQVRPAADGP